MTEMSPEMAFLQAEASAQEATNAQLHMQIQVGDGLSLHTSRAESNSSLSSSTGSSSSSNSSDAGAESGDEEEEYDPDNVVAATDIPADASAQSGTAKSSRIKGGFEEDDSDDERDSGTVPSTNGTAIVIAIGEGKADGEAQRSVTATPHNDVQVSNSEGKSPHLNNPSLKPCLPASTSPLGATPVSTLAPKPNPILTKPGAIPKPAASIMPKVRLPNDTIGLLEDRIAEDERGDVDAWLDLVSEHRNKNRLDDARAVFERFFKLFPGAADEWVSYVQMELENEQFVRVEAIFNKVLLKLPSLKLWSTYLDYVRRRNNLISDNSGKARSTIAQTYEFILAKIGIDKDAGPIWKDYIQFLRSGPGTLGGTAWQDSQKMDTLRKAFRQAIVIPTSELESIWRDYFAFETQLNAVTGRKMIQEQSPGYYTARQCVVQLGHITKALSRATLPRLPRLPGFQGDEEYEQQVSIWQHWIAWELDDPLVLKADDATQYRNRVVHVYKQATICMPFEPRFWYEAAQFCFHNNLGEEGTTFLESGIHANPESALLALMHADRLESTTVKEDGQDALKRRGDLVRQPYNRLLDALYRLLTVNKNREEASIARIQANFDQHMAELALNPENDEHLQAEQKSLTEVQEAQILAIQSGREAQVTLLKKMISSVWVALMRAMRRVQGKGKINDAVGGMRQIFNDARKRGQLTSDVYIASALLEHNAYRDPAAAKIFERGAKLYPDDETLALEYVKHLLDINDPTNARAMFESSVNRLTQNPANVLKAKPLYLFFHHYEANYGEMSQVAKLEQRMKELFPGESTDLFANRFKSPSPQVQVFDLTLVRPLISITAQSRPKSLSLVERASSPPMLPPPSPVPPSPRPANTLLNLTNQQPRASPKRSLVTDDDLAPPRKAARGDSPLFKGAAGRRVNASKGGTLAVPQLPRDVSFFLSILPRSDLCNTLPRFKVPALIGVIGRVNLASGLSAEQNTQWTGAGQGYQTGPSSLPPGQSGYGSR